MKNFKKTIALLLSMLMILAVAPVSAFADDVATINVTFDANGGTSDYDKKAYTVGSEFGSLPTCTRDGYNFLGWYTPADELITESEIVSFTNDITLIAKWENPNAVDMNPFAVIGRFFERIGDLLRMVFEFLENILSGTGNDEIENIQK